jgi:hypothetical protein
MFRLFLGQPDLGGKWLTRGCRALYPQRPFPTDEPSPFIDEGSDAIDVKGTVRELKEKALSEDLIISQGSFLMELREWRRKRRLARQGRVANPRDPNDLNLFLHPSTF